METSVRTETRQLLNSFMVGQVLKSTEGDLECRTGMKGLLLCLSPAWVSPTADLHHAAAWGENMLVPGLCLPGVGILSSLSYTSEQHQIRTGGFSRSYCL